LLRAISLSVRLHAAHRARRDDARKLLDAAARYKVDDIAFA
jgi:hypothetical protein